jgi:Zn-dependent M28 family amino/carboxypeptidase
MIIYKYPGFDVAAAAFKAHDFLPHYVDSVTNNMDAGIPVFALSEQRFNELTPAGTVSARISKQYVTVAAPNVIGILPGSDPKAPCVILSAHHDHNGRNGSTIYYGAVDNASGTVALLEMARLMDLAVKKGFRPKRTIVFASYTGEEEGLLGSAYFSKHPVYPVNDTYAVLNIDMLGRVDTFYSGRRPDSNYVYILVKDSLDRGLRQAVYKANESSVHLILDTHYEDPQFAQRRIRGSDQYPFYLKGVPFVRIDCGFTKDYHQPTDTPDKVDYDLLTRQTKLVFLTLWNMANN